MIKPHEVRAIYEDHCAYWRARRPELRRLRNLYMMHYWKKEDLNDNVSITVESSRGFETIEGYVASLYTRDPAVTVGPDLRGRGDAQVTQAVCNDFLRRARGSIEHATRIGLVFDSAFLKMHPTPGPDPLLRVEVEAVSPWDVIVDAASSTWQSQRWVGHRYLLPLDEARARYGNRRYTPRAYHRFLDENVDGVDALTSTVGQNYGRGGPRDSVPRSAGGVGAGTVAGSTVEQYIEVVEFYDLTPGSDAMVVWSPDHFNGDRYLYKGVKIQVGSSLDVGPEARTGTGQTDEEIDDQSEVYSGIPYRTASGRPLTPIIPLIFTSDISAPLRGYSALRRVADYVQEINIVRSYQANAVRKTARQWMIEKGLLDADAAAKISMGIDGEIIEVELSNGQTLGGSVMPVPHAPTPPELQSYIMAVEGDLARGSILAPFTRGEATRATATEVTAMASYSSSEIGRMARTRDEAISEMARVYSVMLSLILGTATEPLIINGQTTLLTSDDLDADFKFFATDTGATPLADAAKRRNLVELTGVLTQLGVDPQAIRAEIIRLYDLPTSFLGQAQEAPVAASGPGAETGTIAPGATPAPSVTAPQNAAEALARGPSSAGIGPLLPAGV